MPRLSHFVALPMILLTTSFAHAESKEATERAARKACLSGDVTRGVELLSDLFLDTKDATYIFNQGRCFEQNNRYEEAIARFREYLRKASGISTEVRADTEKHIADCQTLLGEKAAPTASSQDADHPLTTTEAAPGTSAASLQIPPAQPTDVSSGVGPAANPGRGLRIAGIACGVIGLASVGAGIYFYTQARYYSDKVTSQAVRDPADENAGNRAETMQWVFYSTGVAALAAGTVLYFVGWHSTADRGGVAGIMPMLGSGLAGISARGAFWPPGLPPCWQRHVATTRNRRTAALAVTAVVAVSMARARIQVSRHRSTRETPGTPKPPKAEPVERWTAAARVDG
jgi:hypothetical protein